MATKKNDPSVVEEIPQTDSHPTDLPELTAEDRIETAAIPQTGTQEQPEPFLQTPASPPSDPEPSISQTDSETDDQPGRPNGSAMDIFPEESISDTSANESPPDMHVESDDASSSPSSVRPTRRILPIDSRVTVQTDADKARNELLDLVESRRSKRILTGTIQGIERVQNDPNRSLAVIYHGDYKVLIPVEEAVTPPEDYRGQPPAEVLNYLLNRRLGAEVDYIVRGIDPEAHIAVASRLEAMRAKRHRYYFGTDRDGNYILYPGRCAEARVVSVIRAGIFVDLFGLESYIPLNELSYQRLISAASVFQPGQRILVKILELERKRDVQVRLSVKQARENPCEKAIRKYTEGNMYVGTVSMVNTAGVFVALDGGIDCLCNYPKRGRPPRGSRVTVRIIGIDYETNRIWGVITHIATPR